ncbi:MAG: alpha/beta fold hydrolase [Euryarchaeota archaeon]|nr:alpha/beta fold hydrolase [Euryarchaeota archaeon]
MEAPSRLERRVVGAIVKRWFGNRRAPLPEVPFDYDFEPIEFRGNGGARTRGRWFPLDGARGTVVLAHPDRRYGQHWFVRSGWIRFLQAAGYQALTFDFPMYGQSRGGSTYLHDDVLAAVDWAKGRSSLPVHVVGLSLGAFAAANASPQMHDVESLVLESPYPTFNAWFARGPQRWAMDAFDRAFPRTARRIQAHVNVANARPQRILVAASRSDRVTPIDLSRRVAAAAPPERTSYLELDGPGHLELLTASAAYREAVLATLAGGAPATPVLEPESALFAPQP